MLKYAGDAGNAGDARRGWRRGTRVRATPASAGGRRVAR